MLRTMLKSTIQRATVTPPTAAEHQPSGPSGTGDSGGAGEFGLGSVTIDEDLLDAADLLPGERVSIVDTNGARLHGYVVAGERGSGVLAVGGPAACLVAAGEQVAVLSYAAMDDGAARAHRPKMIRVDGVNRPLAAGVQPAEAQAETDDAARLDALIQAEA